MDLPSRRQGGDVLTHPHSFEGSQMPSPARERPHAVLALRNTLTISEAAAFLRIRVAAVEAAASRGELPVIHRDAAVFVDGQALRSRLREPARITNTERKSRTWTSSY